MWGVPYVRRRNECRDTLVTCFPWGLFVRLLVLVLLPPALGGRKDSTLNSSGSLGEGRLWRTVFILLFMSGR